MNDSKKELHLATETPKASPMPEANDLLSDLGEQDGALVIVFRADGDVEVAAPQLGTMTASTLEHHLPLIYHRMIALRAHGGGSLKAAKVETWPNAQRAAQLDEQRRKALL